MDNGATNGIVHIIALFTHDPHPFSISNKFSHIINIHNSKYKPIIK
jgi:hypothetical protein